MTKVRAHKVTRNDGTTYTRRAHTRRTEPGAKPLPRRLHPRRAWANAKKAAKAWKHRQRLGAACYATAAVTEVAAFTVMRGVGSVMMVAGIGIAVAGKVIRSAT